ncbi:hypothetical protein REPUB_Repub20aG0120000 [Reevesia pubescens]
MKIFETNGNTLSLTLFTDVINSKELLESMQAGKLNPEGSKHITDSSKRCGISDNSSNVLAARFNASPDEMKAVEKLINGKEIDLEELEGRAYQAQMQKHYKISGPELQVSTLASDAYGVHLVNKMLDTASKTQLAGVISSLRGHVASLLRHMPCALP